MSVKSKPNTLNYFKILMEVHYRSIGVLYTCTNSDRYRHARDTMVHPSQDNHSSYARVQLKNDNGSCPRASSPQPAVPLHAAKSALLRVFWTWRKPFPWLLWLNLLITAAATTNKLLGKSSRCHTLDALFFQNTHANNDIQVRRFGRVLHFVRYCHS